MTAITSSGASDADRARKRTCGCVALIAVTTACPPPPGRCTSRRTTSGRLSAISAIAGSTSSASPTTSTWPPSSGRTPVRSRPCSSPTKARALLRRLAASRRQGGTALAALAVPDGDGLDGCAVAGLRPLADAPRPGGPGHGVGVHPAGRTAAEQPGAQLTLLSPGQLDDLLR